MKGENSSWLPHLPPNTPRQWRAGQSKLLIILVMTLMLVIGGRLTGAIYGTLRQNDELHQERLFASLAEEHVRSISNTMGTYMHSVLATQALFGASEFVSREEFRNFVTPLLQQQPGIRALEWIPRVPKSEEAAYLQAAHVDGYDFPIRPIGNGTHATARTTADFYPVFYVEPQESNSAAFGLDLLSDPTRAQALELARDTARPTSTTPLQFVQDTEQQNATLIFMPHYREKPPEGDIARRRELIAGFVLGVVQFQDLLRDAISDLNRGNVNVALYYNDELLTGSVADTQSNEAGAPFSTSPLVKRELLEMGGRDWTVLCTPTTRFLSSQGTARPLFALLTGLVLTLLGTGYLYTSMRRVELRRALLQSERRYRTLVEHAPEAILLLSADQGRFVDANNNACKLFGLARLELLQVSLTDISAPLQPDGRTAAVAAKTYLQQAADGQLPTFIWIHIDSQGREFPCEVRLVRIPSPDGTLIRGSIIDITERVQNEERQIFMMRELDHRVKNNLATVLSLTEQSAAESRSVDELRSTLAGRIRAMASLHRALAFKQWGNMEIEETFELTFATYNHGKDGDHIRFSGPACTIPPDTCSALCMAAYELATNATKYGALSQPGGRIDVTWRVDAYGITIDWIETDGPPIQAPTHTGYGTRLVTGLVEHQLGGRVDIEWPSTGLICRMFIPTKVPPIYPVDQEAVS